MSIVVIKSIYYVQLSWLPVCPCIPSNSQDAQVGTMVAGDVGDLGDLGV